MSESNLPELLRDMATELVYADKAKNGPLPVEESIPWQAADEIERLHNLWIKAEAQIPPEGSYDELVELERLRARCAELEKALEPFASALGQYEPAPREFGDEEYAQVLIKFGDIRRAATLQGQDNGR